MYEERRYQMTTPNIRYYAKMVYNQEQQGKTPKYTIREQAGYYPPMDTLKGRNGLISMYLMEKLKEGENIPSIRLQAKNSLNFTGLKEFFTNGNLSGYAYGYPLSSKTYSGKGKTNPFYEYKDDGFLFIIHQNKNAQTAKEQITPSAIELIVLEDAQVLIPSYCKMLTVGGFDEAIKSLRKQAKSIETL